MGHDSWFFVGVFVFIFLVWVVTGGPMNPLSFSGPLLQQPGPIGGGTYLSLPKAPLGAGATDASLSGSSSGKNVSQKNAPESVGGIAFGSPSPYRGKVVLIHSVYGKNASDPKKEYIRIRVAQNADQDITLSGWTLVSGVSGRTSVIDVGVKVPRSGVISGGLPITISPGEDAYIISGRSPIGSSFRENICIGYFAEYQTFSPSLPKICPRAETEVDKYYGNYARDIDCKNYVKSISRCESVLTAPQKLSSACNGVLTKYVNYNGCIMAHEQDADFLGDTWRIYLGRESSLWRATHEVVKLLDSEGKTVDAFSY